MSAFLAGGVEAPDLATLIFSAAAALLALASAGGPASIRKTGIVALSMALLSILVVLRDGPLLLAGVLLLAAFGEMLLVQDRLSAYLSGLGVQLAVRAAYGTLFFSVSRPRLFVSEPWRGAVVVLVTLGAIWLLRRIWLHAGPLRWPALIYAFFVLAMCAAAAAVRPPSLLLGALFLAASDVELALDRFLRPRNENTPLSTVRLTFLARYLGQALLVLAGLGLI